MTATGLASVVPAQLSFLTIYNPSLGSTDETIRDQIVFYTSQSTRSQQTEDSVAGNAARQNADNENQQLRQIGLAQGMVNFARNFSEGKALEYVETNRSCTIVHELEKDWWILACVDYTRLPSDSPDGAKSQRNAPEALPFQYSSREVCPPQLLLRHLLRAHSLFLLHHDFSLENLYQRVGRSTFCNLLERFWDKFAWSWEVLLTGNPAVDIFNGIKLSAGGELGVGVGEEEWGSGERAVFEDLVTSTDGLVDMVVSRFGDAPVQAGETTSKKAGEGKHRWLGSGGFPQPSDGVIFAGTGAVSRSSLVQVSQWMEWVYRFGEDAYGIEGASSPSARRRRHRRRRERMQPRDISTRSAKEGSASQIPDRPFIPGIPPPLVSGTPEPPEDSSEHGGSQAGGENSSTGGEGKNDWSSFTTGAFMKYFTLGYGSPWSLWSQKPAAHPRVDALKQDEESKKGDSKSADPSTEGDTGEQSRRNVNALGRFIIGPRGDLLDQDGQSQSPKEGDHDGGSRDGETETDNTKIDLRPLYVRLSPTEADSVTGEPTQLQAVVYAHQPFLFTFLFTPNTPSLTTPTLYKTIQHQLTPLHKPLLSSTSPTTISSRISISDGGIFDSNSNNNRNSNPVYDLVYDPSNLTIRSSIPNIPDISPSPTSSSYTSTSTSTSTSTHTNPNTDRNHNHINNNPWSSRIESVNVHHRLLNTYTETRSHPHDTERTYKTNRGWWVVWIRLSGDDNNANNGNSNNNSNNITNDANNNINTKNNDDDNDDTYTLRINNPNPTSDNNNNTTTTTQPNNHQEAFLLRKASDYVPPSLQHSRGGGSGARFFRDLGGGGGGGGGDGSFSSSSPAAAQSRSSRSELTPGRIAEGVGVDARRYIEGLLSLNR